VSLPPEVKDATLRDAMAKYGEVRVITSENWSEQYRYPVSNGVRLVQLNLKQHIPSHMYIAGNRVFITYEGQNATCYNCNEQGHMSQECPYKPSSHPPPPTSQEGTWASIVKQSASRQTNEMLSEMSNNNNVPHTDTLDEVTPLLESDENKRSQCDGTPSILQEVGIQPPQTIMNAQC
jgi:hypothetical protein